MEKLSMLENHIQKIRTERLKVERRIKLREAHELQSNALRGRTLENELKIIQREKAHAEKRNRKFMNEILESVNSFKDEVGYSSLKRSKVRLKDAKISFAEIIMSHFPQWAEALQDPISFEKQIFAKSLDVLRQKHEKSKEDFKKKLDVHQDIVRTQLEYIEEMKRENDISVERDRILQYMQIEKDEKSQKLAELQSVYQRRFDDVMIEQQLRKQNMLQNAKDRLEKTMIEEPSPADIYKLWNQIKRPGTTQPAPIAEDSRAMTPITMESRAATPMTHMQYELNERQQINLRPQAPQVTQIDRTSSGEKYEFSDLMNRESPDMVKRDVAEAVKRGFTFGEAENGAGLFAEKRQPKVIMVNPDEIPDDVDVYVTPQLIQKPAPQTKTVQQPLLTQPQMISAMNLTRAPTSVFQSQNQVPIPVIQKEPPKMSISQKSKPQSIETHAATVSNPKGLIQAVPKYSEDEEPEFNIVTIPRNPEPTKSNPPKLEGRAVPVNIDYSTEQPLVISTRSQDKEFEIKPNVKKTEVQIGQKPVQTSNVKILKPTEETLATINRQAMEPQVIQLSNQPGMKGQLRNAVAINEEDIESPIIIQQEKVQKLNAKLPQTPIEEDSEFMIVQQTPKRQSINIIQEQPVAKPKPTGEPQVVLQQPIAIPKEKLINKSKPQPPYLDLSSAKEGIVIEATTSPIDVPIIQTLKKPENPPVSSLASNIAQTYNKKGRNEPDQSRISNYSVPMHQTQIPEAPRIEEESLENDEFQSLYLKGVIERANNTPQNRSRSSSIHIQNRGETYSTQKSMDTSMNSSGPLRFTDLSGRLSPTSSMSSSSRMLETPALAIESSVIANIDPYQRINCLHDLINTAKQQFSAGKVKNLNIKEKIPNDKLDSIASKYLEKGRLDIKSPEELVMFIAAFGKSQATYFFPYDLIRSKKQITEHELLAKMHPECREVYGILKEFLIYCIRSNLLIEKVGLGILVDSMLNYKTSKNQWKRAASSIERFIGETLHVSGSSDALSFSSLQSPDRPVTPSRVSGRADDRSFSQSRGPKPPLTPGRAGVPVDDRSTTPNRAGVTTTSSYWKNDSGKSSAGLRSGNSGSMGEVSKIDDFQEVEDEDFI